MKKILFISSSLVRGGLERQLVYFLEGYDRSLFSVSLLLLHDKIEYEIPADVELIVLPRHTKRVRSFLFWTIFKYRKAIICSRAYSRHIMMFCGVLRHSKLIIEIRGSGSHLGWYYNLVRKYLRLFKLKWQLVCNSRGAYLDLQKLISPRNTLHFVKNGIDLEKFPFMPTEKRRKGAYAIGFLGRIDRIKNIELLIAACGILKKELNFTLKIKGDQKFDIRYQQELAGLVQTNELEERVIWEPESDDVTSFYYDLDVLVIPSFSEGCSNVLLEAIACGCVCAISKPANTNGLLPEEFTFYPDDPEKLADLIHHISALNNEQRMDAVKINRQLVERDYDLLQMVNTYSSIYSERSGQNLQ